MSLSPDTLLVRGDDFMSAPLDDEIVILNLDQNCYVALDEIGRACWEHLAAPTRFDDLCRHFADTFAGDAATIRRDLEALVSELQSMQMVKIVA